MEKGLVRICLSIVVVLLLGGAAVWFVSRSSSNSQPPPKPVTVAEDKPLEALLSQLNRPPVNVAVAVVPWAAKSPAAPAPIKPQPVSTHISAATVAPIGPDVAVLPWDQAPKAEPRRPTAAPSKPQEPVAVVVLPWGLDAKGAIRPVQPALPTPSTRPSANSAAQAVASNFTPDDIPTASLPWETSKPAKRLTHPALPPDPVEYAQAITNCPTELIEWLKAWEADQATHKSTSDAQLWALSQDLESTPLTFAQLFDLGQRVQNAEGDHVGVIFYHAAEPLAAAELATFAIGDPKAKPVLDMLWNMQWCLGNAEDWSSALANATLLLQHEPANSRAAFLAEYQFAEATYKLEGQAPDSHEKSLTMYQQMLDRNGPDRLPVKERDEVHWAMGVILFSGRCYGKAEPYLYHIAQESGSAHRADAYRMLIQCRCQLDRVADAEQSFNQWKDQCAPESSQTIALLNQIDATKIRLLQSK